MNILEDIKSLFKISFVFYDSVVYASMIEFPMKIPHVSGMTLAEVDRE